MEISATMPPPKSKSLSFSQRLRHGGIEPSDPEELRIHKTIVVFAMGLMTAGVMLWVGLYWLMGLQLSATLPFSYQVISVATLLAYIATRNFAFFQYAQLCLFLFFPFVVQLSIGNYISASGAVLWGILAPITAVVVLGARESVPWFAAQVTLMLICGYFDYELAGTARSVIPEKTSAAFLALNFTAITAMVYLLLRYAANEKQRYQARLEATNRALMAEQERSERLLLNILPGAVAARLKQEKGTIADGFADVTVMFADIVNFTSIAEGMSPNQIFTMLNRIFSEFDSLAEEHGLEKIKTIGDAYMIAGGLNKDSVNYTEGIANMALGMRKVLETDAFLLEKRLQIRIGIGTGPVVAGVVGKKKFIYDLWGDTVNLTSRITTEGVPGMIHTDATTYRRLRNAYEFESPQTIFAKGKGETMVYRLIGRRQDPARQAGKVPSDAA